MNLEGYRTRFETVLEAYLKRHVGGIAPIDDAVRYGILGGGKRVRPILAYLGAEFCGKPLQDVDNIACAVEMIHSYSLIHDDLPCMDNDILRRGKPTVHVAFGEDIAVLAGDGLLTMAFGAALDRESFDSRCAQAVDYIARMAGVGGMIGGQCIDIGNDSRQALQEESVLDLYDKKTGCLLRAALVGSAIQCGADRSELQALERYAESLGRIFQITDDILDITSNASTLGKSIGKDARSGKRTYAAVVGVEKARRFVTRLEEQATAALQPYGTRGSDLVDFCNDLTRRLS